MCNFVILFSFYYSYKRIENLLFTINVYLNQHIGNRTHEEKPGHSSFENFRLLDSSSLSTHFTIWISWPLWRHTACISDIRPFVYHTVCRCTYGHTPALRSRRGCPYISCRGRNRSLCLFLKDGIQELLMSSTQSSKFSVSHHRYGKQNLKIVYKFSTKNK